MTLRTNKINEDINCRLYRTVHEIFHPTISKKNISNYKIIFGNELLPVMVYYPNKVSNLDRVIIYVHGENSITECSNSYNTICNKIATTTDSLVIALDYPNLKWQKLIKNCFQSIDYLSTEIEKEGIEKEKIILMGDSTGASIINGYQKNYKKLLFYPPITGDYFTNKNNKVIAKLGKYFSSNQKSINKRGRIFINTNIQNSPIMLIVGKLDPLYKEIFDYKTEMFNKGIEIDLIEIDYVGHGFLKDIEKTTYKPIFDKINTFFS